MPAPGKLDPELKEFWAESPWAIAAMGHNLSMFERDRVYLNVAGAGGASRDFVDISHLTGADSDGDGRSVVAADFRNCGQLDLLVRRAGGGPLTLYENRFARRHSLQVSLEGQKSNRLGIGARIVATAGGRTIVRELYPQNTFRSQAPASVHFGLADASVVDRLVVHWPSGLTQELTGIPADRHIRIVEGASGAGAVTTVVPGTPKAR
jgi:hypothetical protein